MRNLIGFLLLLCGGAASVLAQQPFNTDDAEVTDYHHWHVEAANEYDDLQPASFPSLRQNTFNLKFAYGLVHNVEVGADNQLILIHNAPTPLLPRDALGLGDFDFSVKWRIHEEKSGSPVPAFAASFAVEFPTGDARLGLGSGLTDYTLNLIMQKSLSEANKWRLNGGVVFAGNTQTGALGVKTRGTLFTGGTSFVRNFTKRLDLGVEITGVASTNLNLTRGALQLLGGGNYEIRKDFTFDFALTGGWFAGSPRIGPQIGFSYNW